MDATWTLVAFAATADADAARAFYRDVLGLTLVHEDLFALVFDANGVPLRLAKVKALTPVSHTVLGWEVGDIAAATTALRGKGVAFERFPHMEQDAAGVWRAPGRAAIVWFRDPDGNLLSFTQPPA